MNEQELMALPEITTIDYYLEESLDDRFYLKNYPPQSFQVIVRCKEYHWFSYILTQHLYSFQYEKNYELKNIQEGWLGFLNLDPGIRRINAQYWSIWEYPEDLQWQPFELKPLHRISHSYLMRILQQLQQQERELRTLSFHQQGE